MLYLAFFMGLTVGFLGGFLAVALLTMASQENQEIDNFVGERK